MHSSAKRWYVHRHQRRGAVIAFVAVVLVVLIGFVGLTVNVGRMVVARTELQNTADAAALAAAQDLGGVDYVRAMAVARQSVATYIDLNRQFSSEDVVFEPDRDVVFGQARLDAEGTGIAFMPNVLPPNAVNVTVHSTVRFALGEYLGMTSGSTSASATSAINPRDLMIVLDVSRSMASQSDELLVTADLNALGIPVVGVGGSVAADSDVPCGGGIDDDDDSDAGDPDDSDEDDARRRWRDHDRRRRGSGDDRQEGGRRDNRGRRGGRGGDRR